MITCGGTTLGRPLVHRTWKCTENLPGAYTSLVPSCLVFTRLAHGTKYQSPLDYYKILRVPHDATPQQVKAAYYELSKIHHPDVKTEDSDATSFTLINEAYETLGDPIKRQHYDNKHSSFGHLQRRPHQPRDYRRRPPTIHPYYSQFRDDGWYESPRTRRDEFYDELYRRQYEYLRRQYRIRNDLHGYQRRPRSMYDEESSSNTGLHIFASFSMFLMIALLLLPR